MLQMTRLGRIAAGTLAAAGLFAAALVGPASAGSAKTIKVGDNFFVRNGGATVSVKRGTTVRWVWRGSSSHNVTVQNGPVRFRSRTQTSGTFSKRLTRPGVYSIICTIHGPAMTMKLRVT